MSFEIRALIAISSPALMASIFLIAARRGGRSGQWGAAIGSAIGYLAGQGILLGLPSIPPGDVTYWPFYFALVAGLFSLVDLPRARPLPRFWRLFVRDGTRGLFMIAVAGLLLWPVIGETWQASSSKFLVLSLGLITLLAWVNLANLIEKVPAAVSSWALLLPSLAMVPLLIFSHSAVLGQLGLIAASALVPSLVLAWWRGDAAPLRGILTVAMVLTEALLISGYYYGDGMTLSGVLCVVLAPLFAWIAALGPLKRWNPKLLGLLVAMLIAIPLGIALGLAAKDYLSGLEG